jgi:hypothetical protein
MTGWAAPSYSGHTAQGLDPSGPKMFISDVCIKYQRLCYLAGSMELYMNNKQYKHGKRWHINVF